MLFGEEGGWGPCVMSLPGGSGFTPQQLVPWIKLSFAPCCEDISGSLKIVLQAE